MQASSRGISVELGCLLKGFLREVSLKYLEHDSDIGPTLYTQLGTIKFKMLPVNDGRPSAV